MHRSTWKAGERRVASIFGSRRNPLSGGNSGVTRSDSRHDTLFIEAKHSKKHAVWTLHDATKVLAKKEKKIPVIALLRLNSPGVIFCVHSDSLDDFITAYHASKRLMAEASKKKRKRKKGNAA